MFQRAITGGDLSLVAVTGTSLANLVADFAGVWATGTEYTVVDAPKKVQGV
jgi:hypothetical protein